MQKMLTLPGIIHFIYVNRTANRATAPAMDPLCKPTASAEEQSQALTTLHRNVCIEGHVLRFILFT